MQIMINSASPCLSLGKIVDLHFKLVLKKKKLSNINCFSGTVCLFECSLNLQMCMCLHMKNISR